MTDFQQGLNKCRQTIDDIDCQILDLLAKRREITTEVGRLKSEAGKPIYDAQREASLLAARRDEAEKKGVSPELIEDILKRIIKDSYSTQKAAAYKCVNPQCNKIVVVGGKGQLGRVFVDLFTRSNYNVECLEENDWLNSETILADASLVVVAVPIRLTVDIIKQLKHLSDNCILADVTSIKESPLQAMLTVHKGPVVGFHPMFGPDISDLMKQTIIACDGRMSEQYQWLLEQFNIWGAKVYSVSAKEHDKAMSLVQVMRHFSTIAYGKHLMEEGANIEQLLEMSSPIYRLELIMVGRLFAQDPALYTDIIFNNPDNIQMMKEYAQRFLSLLNEVERQDKISFMQEFETISDWFGEYAQTFMLESRAMLAKANELKKR